MTTFTPLVFADPHYAKKSSNLRLLLESSQAQTLGVRAIAQRYTIRPGSLEAAAHPLFWCPDARLGQRLSWQSPENTPFGYPFQSLSPLWKPLHLGQHFHDAFINCTHQHVWLVGFEDRILLQAHTITTEIAASLRLLDASTLHRSSWARGAYATMITAPAPSSHAALRWAQDTPDRFDALEALRGDAMADARAAGYDLSLPPLATIIAQIQQGAPA